MKRICIGVPFMNLIDLTIDFLKLIEKNTDKIDQIILVDNGILYIFEFAKPLAP